MNVTTDFTELKRTLTIVVILIFGFYTSYAQIGKKNKEIELNFININKLTVFQFIELLRTDKEDSKKSPKVLTISGMQTPENWLTKSDVDSLVTLINSTDSAKCIMLVISSYYPLNESSTIGGQILSIIKAYKDKKKYPTFLTSCAKTDQKQIAEIENWWNEQKK
jgi:hypothetical protein